MRLKPVAESRPQHTCSGALRTALHDEVFAIEKIGGVSAIERKRLESWEWRENRGGPLPHIAQHVMYTKGAAAFGKSIDRRWIPMAEVKVAQTRIRLEIAPGILAFRSISYAISRSVPLFFCRERLPRPTRVRRGLRMTHVDRPVERQRDFFEHAAIEPAVGRLFPEHWMRNCVSRLPVPVVVAPESAHLIAASGHEIEVLPARNL